MKISIVKAKEWLRQRHIPIKSMTSALFKKNVDIVEIKDSTIERCAKDLGISHSVMLSIISKEWEWINTI